MSTTEQDYVLGTDTEELHRLGIQHQIWSTEAQRAWDSAGFTAGQTFLDLGAGPGYCAVELAYIAGKEGKVIAVDKSKSYLEFLDRMAREQNLNITTIASDFEVMELDPNSIDGMYSRWALAWLAEPKSILQKVMKALKPGGKMVIHEYYNWSTHQTEPRMEHLAKAISAAQLSMNDTGGNLDVGRAVPGILSDLGMNVLSIRPMAKIARPHELAWQWPKSFFKVYFPKLVPLGYLSDEEVSKAFSDLGELELIEGASLCCPLMFEVIAEKV